MARLSRDKKRDQQHAAAPAASAAAPIDVHVPASGPGAGAAWIGDIRIVAAPGEEVQQAVLTHLHHLAADTGHAVLATIRDERIGYVVPLQVDPDGASRFTEDPTPLAPPAERGSVAGVDSGGTRTGTPASRAGDSGRPGVSAEPQQPRHDLPTHLLRPVDEPVRDAVPTFRMRAVPEAEPGDAAGPGFPPGAAAEPEPQGGTVTAFPPAAGESPHAGGTSGAGELPHAGKTSPAGKLSHAGGSTPAEGAPPAGGSYPADESYPAGESSSATGSSFAAGESYAGDELPPAEGSSPAGVPPSSGYSPPAGYSPPTFPLRALPDPPTGHAPGTVVPPTGEFGPPPVMDARPEPLSPVEPPPSAPPVRPSPSVTPLLPDLGREPEPDPKPTPPRGFDAVAEAVLGDDPMTAPGDGTSPPLLAEPLARINEAVKSGRTDTAVELADRTLVEASGTLGPEHPEVLRLRELAAYIAYLAGDPVRSFQLSLDLAHVRHHTRDAEAAYGNVQSAFTAWRAVRDPLVGLELGHALIGLWAELTAEDGPAADDIEQLDKARARMGRLTERAENAR